MEYVNMKSLILGMILGVSVGELWKIYRRIFYRKKSLYYECLFFTPKQVICTSKCKSTPGILGNFTLGKEALPCNNCSLKSLSSLLDGTRKHLDVCMYLITSEEICNTILNVFRRGVHVRIIIDKQVTKEAIGASAKLLQFRKEYVPIKIIQSSCMMHNKFAVIDKETVLIGSVNWTKQGFSGNYENLLAVTHSEIAEKYNEYFDLLWSMGEQ